eukprot:9296017-Pyramimonas_sp.AAC.1
MGRAPHFQATLDSLGGGTHGGAAFLAQKGLAFQKFLTQCSGINRVGCGACWLFLELKLGGYFIAIGVCYLVASIGMAGENMNRMRDICLFVRTLAVPWVILGDFNKDPQGLADSGWFELTRSCPLVPKSVDFTCDAGEAMIDFLVCSRGVYRAIDLKAVLTAPLKTHACLLAEIGAD